MLCAPTVSLIHYKPPSEFSEPLLLSDKSPSELSEPLLLSDKSPSELSESLLLSDKSPSELSESLLLSDKSPSELSESLLLTDESPSDCSDLPLTHYERAADSSATLSLSPLRGKEGGRPLAVAFGAVLLCGSLCLSGLCLWLTSGVPESGNVEGIAFDIIDNLVEPTYYDAAVGLSTMGEKRVYLAHRGHVGQGMRSLFNLVHEFLTDALAKIPQDVFLYLMQLGGGSLVPVNLHTLTFSLWWNTSSLVRYSPASKAASASSSISSISCIV